MSRLVGWSTISAIALLLSASPVAAQSPEEQACRGGDTQACFTVGMHYLGNMDNAPNVERSMPFFTNACDGGVGKACVGSVGNACSMLGVMYQNGTGVTQDIARSLSYYTKGCDLGASLSCQQRDKLNGTATVAAASHTAPAAAPAPSPAASGQSGEATFEGIRIGMSQDDVRRKLGDPVGRAPSTDGGETWAFRGRTLGVTFDGHRSVSGVVAIAREAGGFEGIRIEDELSTLKDLSSKRGWKVDDLGTMLLISGSGWTLLASGQAGKIAMLTWTAAGN